MAKSSKNRLVSLLLTSKDLEKLSPKELNFVNTRAKELFDKSSHEYNRREAQRIKSIDKDFYETHLKDLYG
jgi:ribosomal protein S21